MSGMSVTGRTPSGFVRLACFVLRHRGVVLVASALAFVLSGIVGGGVAKQLSSGGFDDPSAESTHAEQYLKAHFPAAGTPNIVLLVTADPGLTVDSPEVAATGAALTAELGAEAHVVYSASYWSTGSAPPLRTDDSHRALVFARLDGDSNAVNTAMKVIGPRYQRAGGGVTV